MTHLLLENNRKFFPRQIQARHSEALVSHAASLHAFRPNRSFDREAICVAGTRVLTTGSARNAAKIETSEAPIRSEAAKRLGCLPDAVLRFTHQCVAANKISPPRDVPSVCSCGVQRRRLAECYSAAVFSFLFTIENGCRQATPQVVDCLQPDI